MSQMVPPQEHVPLTGTARIVGTVSLSLATFMNVLDTSIANVSLSSIAGDLGVSTTQYVNPTIPALHPYVGTLEAGGLSATAASAVVNHTIDVESRLLAANDLWASSIAFILMVGLVWLARPVLSRPASDAVTEAH